MLSVTGETLMLAEHGRGENAQFHLCNLRAKRESGAKWLRTLSSIFSSCVATRAAVGAEAGRMGTLEMASRDRTLACTPVGRRDLRRTADE